MLNLQTGIQEIASLLSPPSSSVLEKGHFCHWTPCLHTRALGLWAEPVYQSGDTQASPPLSRLLRGGKGRAFLPQAILLWLAPLASAVPLLMEYLCFWNSLLSFLLGSKSLGSFNSQIKCHLPRDVSQLHAHPFALSEAGLRASRGESYPCCLQAEECMKKTNQRGDPNLFIISSEGINAPL